MIRTNLSIAVSIAVLGCVGFAQQTEPPGQPGVSLQIPLDDSSRELHLYPVRPYVDVILDVQHGIELLRPEDRQTEARQVVRRLRDAIRRFVQPQFEDGEEIQALGYEHLALVGRAAQHAWARRFLELQKDHAGTIAIIDIEILKASPKAFAALEIGEQPRVLDAEHARAFRERLSQTEHGLDRLQAPRLAVLAMQHANVSALEQTSYVKDFKVEELDGGVLIADPEVAVLEAGLTLDGSFVVVDRDTIGLSWQMKLMDLKRPIPTFETKLSTGQSVTIQLPNVVIANLDAEVVLTPGALSVFPGPEVRGDRVILLMSIAELRQGGVEPGSDEDGPVFDPSEPERRKH